MSGMYRKKFQGLITLSEHTEVPSVCVNFYVGIVYKVKSSLLDLVQKSTVRIIQLLWGAQEIR